MKNPTHRTLLWLLPLNLAAVIVIAVTTGLLLMPNTSAPTADHHPHHKALVDEDGQWKHTNALIDATSPYLLQHAHNPVDWYPWGETAFAKAAKENKPIFLSVGYATCYWCHVMERQVFENPDIAQQMNAHFVNIKVDREQRPDIDDIYMTAVQALTQRGGWPMSVFLTPPGTEGEDDPGLKPFFAGTYFPPEPTQGMPSFPQVLEHIHKLWTDDQPKVIEAANNLTDAVKQHLSQQVEPVDLGPEPVQQSANTLMRAYDQEHGGFGSAPKFPTPANLAFLLAVYRNNQSDELWQVVAHTLDRMARGGMYDQIGGGFHRYAVDEKWLVPHFEKMLYDNAQLIDLYAEAHTLRPPQEYPQFYKQVVLETFGYLEREMIADNGAFYSAQDAEVDAKEGGNYVWTAEEIKAALPDKQLAQLAMAYYGLDEGSNFKDPHAPDAMPVNVLYVPTPTPEFAEQHNLSLDALQTKIETIDQHLLAARDQRKQPTTDDKVLVEWNGMMIGALAKAGRLLDESKMVERAKLAAGAILQNMSRGEHRLYRTMRNGQAGVPAFLDDYAWMIHGLIELARATEDPRFLQQAQRYIAVVQEDFAAEQGGYYDTLEDQRDLFVRTRNFYDGATPAGNSVMVHNLLDLYELTQEPAYLRQAIRTLQSFSGLLEQNGANMVHMQHALLRALELSPQIAEASETADASSPEHGAVRERQDAVQAIVTPDEISLAEGQASFTVQLEIEEGYHINGPDAPQGFVPTQLSLVGGSGVELDVQFPEAQQKTLPFADQPLNVFEGQVQIRATLRTVDGTMTPPDAVLLTVQSCSDRECLQPREMTLPLKIESH